MNREQFSLIVVLALIAGLIGGVVSNQFLMGQPFLAEKKPPHEKEIKAERFIVVNEKGESKGMFGCFRDYSSNVESALLQLGMETLTLGAEAESVPPALFRLFRNDYGVTLDLDARGRMGSISLKVLDRNQSLELYDKHNNLRAVLGTTQLKDKRTGSTERRAPSSLVFFDEKGNVVWKAP